MSISASARWAIGCTSTCSRSNRSISAEGSAWRYSGGNTSCRSCRFSNTERPGHSGRRRARASPRPVHGSKRSCVPANWMTRNSAGSTRYQSRGLIGRSVNTGNGSRAKKPLVGQRGLVLDEESNAIRPTDALQRLGERRLTAAEFQHLAAVPAAIEWFANIDNPRTRRADQKDLDDFCGFVGLSAADEFRAVTRSHVLA